MTRAKITRKPDFKCAPDGHTVVAYPYGTVVDGVVADWALDAKAASRMLQNPVMETKIEAPAEVKAKRKRGRK